MSLARAMASSSVLKENHRQHRAKNLLAGDPHRGFDLVEDRGFDEKAAGLLQSAFAAQHELGAFALAALDVTQHLLHVALFDHRADLGRRIQRVADDPFLGHLEHPRQQLVFELPVDDQPRAGAAVLTHVPEHAVDGLPRDIIEVARIFQAPPGDSCRPIRARPA